LPLGVAHRGPRNPLAGFEGPLRGGKRGEREGREGKGKTGKGQRERQKTPLSEINF